MTTTVTKYLFQKFQKLLSAKHVYLTQSLSFRSKAQALPPNFDYIRYATLGLCCEEILSKNVSGSLAEVGVYQGSFAKRLNQLFPHRTLYLFDTFEGFASEDISVDQESGFSAGNQDFSNTSVEQVRRQMPYPNACVFKKGFFPQTAAGIEDRFCFVSLDADLYAPIYEGLKFFYPRLEEGGYIFIHDFNNDQYKGARQAVVQYCNENQIGYIPLPDSGGTAIVCK